MNLEAATLGLGHARLPVSVLITVHGTNVLSIVKKRESRSITTREITDSLRADLEIK
jgi:rhamnose utilization protein RhaD (predicted bifunctional aldolase and dehydrogenase)